MKAAGRTITVGELIEHFSTFDQNEPIRIVIYGDTETIEELDDTFIYGPNDDHVYQSAHELLNELHEFKGTKKKMLEMIAQYAG